uniref:Protein PXR1-like n=1 Tax=Nicotiana tabacum TaxID=4097 RepID=A0A1S4BAQ1_TOBAC|nr:PREDICTED: protein PXR1-like [Nicotiana tabacum]
MGSTSSKSNLKKRLLEVLANIDTASPVEVQAMLEAASASSSTENQDNGDMEDPQDSNQASTSKNNKAIELHNLQNRLSTTEAEYNALKEKGDSPEKLAKASKKISETVRFTGMLKNWWDNYLSEENKNQILGATTVAAVVKTESGMQVAEQEAREDASATLIYCLDLCTDLKLKNLIKKDKLQSKTELGSFCQDFGFKTIVAPSKRAKQHKTSSEKSKKRHERKEKKEGTPKKKRFKRRSKKEHGDKRWSCGKIGHRANECPVTNKKNKKVNSLEIHENTKETLFAILEQNDKNTLSSSSDESYSDSDDEVINMAYSSYSSSSSKEDNNEIKAVKLRLDKIEMENLTKEILQAANKKETIGEYFSEDDKYDDDSVNGTVVAKITKAKAQSYHIPITLKVKDITLNKLALLDSGADRNCIMEEIIRDARITHVL